MPVAKRKRALPAKRRISAQKPKTVVKYRTRTVSAPKKTTRKRTVKRTMKASTALKKAFSIALEGAVAGGISLSVNEILLKDQSETIAIVGNAALPLAVHMVAKRPAMTAGAGAGAAINIYTLLKSKNQPIAAGRATKYSEMMRLSDSGLYNKLAADNDLMRLSANDNSIYPDFAPGQKRNFRTKY